MEKSFGSVDKRGFKMKNNLLVLMSSLNANIDQLIQSSNFETDVIIVNQSDSNNEYQIAFDNFTVYVFESTERGLSKSRNLALEKAKSFPHEYILFADDDVEYLEGYSKSVLDVYKEKSDASIVIFDFYNIDQGNLKDIKINHAPNYSIKKSQNPYKYFSSVKISARKQFIYDNKIIFNEKFGTGSNIVSHGEDSLFISQSRKNNAVIYVTNIKILKLDTSDSTWRNITNEKFFSDKGKLWKKLSPKLYFLLGIPLVLKISHEKKVSFIQSYKHFINGSRVKI